MPPKKKAQKKKDVDTKFQQVDKTFYELEIAELNRKLARLRSEQQVLTDKTVELQTKLDDRDVDSVDVIEHLKRVSEEAQKQLEEHKIKLNALQQAKDDEAADCKKRLQEADSGYRLMHQQLSNDKKLLAGKLNNLEEFRIVRDDLMKKFAHQEKLIEEREKQYQRTMYELERLHILAKDRLKSEMEQRLYQLSTDFKRSAEMCIADTTKRVIRENIYVNNELTAMIETHRRLESENQVYRQRDQHLVTELWMDTCEKEGLFHCKRVREQVIQKLETRHEKLKTSLKEAEHHAQDAREAREQARLAKLATDSAENKVRVLEQNLHAAACERTQLLQEALTWMEERTRLRDCVRHAIHAARAAMAAFQRGQDDIFERLVNIVCVLEPVRSLAVGKRSVSLDTIPSLGVIYKDDGKTLIPVSSTCRTLAIQETFGKISVSSGGSIGTPKPSDISEKEGSLHSEEGKIEESYVSPTISSLERMADEYEEGEQSSETFYSVDFAGDADTTSVHSISKSDYMDDELIEITITSRSSTTLSEETSAAEEPNETEKEHVDKQEGASNP